ncbi:hypothetical protein E2C01_034045 [Portunus trituberculatus]|uniref:Uncharacterized protein n=1 Tax=Portunus trituberculatus TaxID=210409 RepID=A0A5B7F4E8_PORTR|nr:hypothetical protein [Portunus trituberculatus]
MPTLAEQRVAQTKWLKGTLTLHSDRFRERSNITGEPHGLPFELKSPSEHSTRWSVTTLPPKYKILSVHSQCSAKSNNLHCTLPFHPEKPETKHGKEANIYSSLTWNDTNLIRILNFSKCEMHHNKYFIIIRAQALINNQKVR